MPVMSQEAGLGKNVLLHSADNRPLRFFGGLRQPISIITIIDQIPVKIV